MFFRCLKLHFKNVNTVLYYLNRWICFNKLPIFSNNSIGFKGVTRDNMSKLQECFNVKIKIFNENDTGCVNLIFDSICSIDAVMYLNNFENHLSYITEFKKFVRKYECKKCSKMFKSEWNLKRHYSTCYDTTKYIFPVGFYESDQTIFNKKLTKKLEYFRMKDMTDKLHWISRHEPISASIALNVDGYSDPRCFVDIVQNSLIKKMNFLKEISKVNANNLKLKYLCL